MFLDNTTGEFLDDPNDAAVTGARRQALLDFVRGGKGLAGIHAAADSYHHERAGAGRGHDRPVRRPRTGGFGIGGFLGSAMLTQGDANHDQKLSTAEAGALAGAWFARLDEAKAGSVTEAQFGTGFGPVVFSGRGRGRGGRSGTPAAAPAGPFPGKGTWPDFNRMIGAYFKWHWLDPQLITVKIDDPNSPLTAMFHGQEFQIHDETYTFAQSSWSRRNVHVLTSIDYAKMSPEDRAKENWPRTDHDYGLSWIRREGNGRVFYEAHGHSERIYAITPMLEHILAGVQYAIGDLKADDSPSVK